MSDLVSFPTSVWLHLLLFVSLDDYAEGQDSRSECLGVMGITCVCVLSEYGIPVVTAFHRSTLTPYFTMIPPISFAFVAALAFSGLNASVGYLTGIMDIPVAQAVLIRNVSPESSHSN